jgi:hypothetical protein
MRVPNDRDWERAALLEPRPAPRDPALIGDGAGLPFPPAVLDGAGSPLDPEDPATGALVGYLAARLAPKSGSRIPWKRGRSPSPSPSPPPSLEGWRLLARADGEVLFGLGRPPNLQTLALREDKHGDWACIGASPAPSFRAVRERIRASAWRLDPSQESWSEATILRVLVTERTFANGKRADGRVLPPDIYVDDRELVLTVFVTPRQGFQGAQRNPETPVRIALSRPVGGRILVDGAVPRLH